MAYTNNFTKEEQKALAIEKVNRTITKISTDVLTIFDNERFADYLEFVAKFHHYDVNNTILIYNQSPSATFLASFKAWEQFGIEYWGDPNRPVFTSSQKGKGIGILAPYILKRKAETSAASTRQAVSYFDYHVVFVFDKEQINNIPVPVVPWDLSKSNEDSKALFEAFREKAPFAISFTRPGEQTSKFLYKPAENAPCKDFLYLNGAEIGNYYILCSYIVKNFVVRSLRKTLKASSEDEFQKTCECVTFILSSYFGLPVDRDAFFFVKFWGGNDPKRMINILNAIQSNAHRLIEVLEEEMVFQKIKNDTSEMDTDDDDIIEIMELDGSFDF